MFSEGEKAAGGRDEQQGVTKCSVDELKWVWSDGVELMLKLVPRGEMDVLMSVSSSHTVTEKRSYTVHDMWVRSGAAVTIILLLNI